MSSMLFNPKAISRNAADKHATICLKDRIKRNNFEYGSAYMDVQDRYRTVNMKTYFNQGDSSQIKARLDAQKSKDLKCNHFDIGGSTANTTQSLQAKQYRPGSAVQRRDARQ